MLTSPMTGILPIVVTPFEDQGSIDETSISRHIEFNLPRFGEPEAARRKKLDPRLGRPQA